MLKEFREHNPNKKIIAYIYGGGYSGAYLMSLGANKIVCQPASGVGSIGVITSFLTLKKLFKKYGIESYVLRKPESKAYPTIYDDLNEQYVQELYGKIVDEFYTKFAEIVSEERHMPIDKVKKLSGKIYSCQDGLRLGLVDNSEYYYKYIDNLKKELENKGYSVSIMEKTKKKNPFEELFGEALSNLINSFVEVTVKCLIKYIFVEQPYLMKI